MQSLLRLFILTASVLLMSGCGVRYLYSQLDWLAPRYVADFVTLDQNQRAELDSRLEEVIAWHCSNELSEYALALRTLDATLAKERLDVASLNDFAGQAEAAWGRLRHQITPHASALLLSLRPDQVDELQRNFEQRNDKQRKEYLSPNDAQRVKLRAERMEKQLRRWFGRLEANQRELIAGWSTNLQPTTDTWLAHRIEWQKRLLDELRSSRDDEQLTRQVIESLLLNPDQHWNEEYRRAFDNNRAHTIALLASLHETVNERQGQHLTQRLKRYADQFERLAACRA